MTGGAAAGRRIAVVLFNLGAPDRPEAVRPFLFNLFNDKSILRVPWPFRFFLAQLLSRRRTRPATAIYEKLGGGSPLLANTRDQAAALETALQDLGEVRVFIAMRYWHPMSDEIADQVRAYAPDEVLLLPLYPQFSSTTTASSVRVWRRAAAAAGLRAPSRLVCCYPTHSGLIDASVGLIRRAYDAAAAHGRPRVLFSAHGLPESIVAAGDPYQWQCEQTAAALVDGLGIEGLDWVSCYQSRVGPLTWIGPSTDDEVRRAGRDGVPVVIAPIAFVSEHSETLVEIELDYRHLAAEVGVPAFERVPAVGVEPDFIAGLAELCRTALAGDRAICSQAGGRICPARWSSCPQREAPLPQS